LVTSSILGLPTNSSGKTEPGVICGTAAQADYDPSGAVPAGCKHNIAQAKRIQIARVKLVRLKHCHANNRS